MARYSIQGSIWIDDEVEDGYVLAESDEDRSRLYLSRPTYRALVLCEGAMPRLAGTLLGSNGLHLLPRSVIEPEAAHDLRLSLDLVDPEPSGVCIHPPCSQPAVVVHEGGFPLCGRHAELLRGWDDLVA